MVSEKNRLNDLNGKEWIKRTISWFTLNVKKRTEKTIKHPGKYPEELVERYVSFFTKKDEWVIDPFVGVGSTLIACQNLQRNAVGIDLNEEFITITKNRLSQKTIFELTKQHIIKGDSKEIDKLLKRRFKEKIPLFDFCMTSPPYWNMLSKQRGGSDSQHRETKEKGLKLVYSSDEKDIGNIENYSNYLNELIEIFIKLRNYLKNKAYLVVVLQNIMDENGNFVPIAWDFCYRMHNYYEINQEQIWCQTDKTVGIWGFPTKYVSNVHHHYCLVFRNTKMIETEENKA